MRRSRKPTQLDVLRHDLRWDIMAAESHIDLGEQLLRSWQGTLRELEDGTLGPRLRASIAEIEPKIAVSRARKEQAERTLTQLEESNAS